MEIMPGIEVFGPSDFNASTLESDGSSMMKGIETYSFCSMLKKHEMNSGQGQVDPKTVTPIITLLKGSNEVNFYLNAATNISAPEYLNAICVNLCSVPENFVVNMYLGSALDDYHTIGVSSLIHAVQTCRATINTFAYGMCSIPESMIWTYGKTRSIGKYGVLRFGGGEWLRRMEEAFKPYINTYLNHCKDLNILTDEMIENILVKQKEYMFMTSDTGELILV